MFNDDGVGVRSLQIGSTLPDATYLTPTNIHEAFLAGPSCSSIHTS